MSTFFFPVIIVVFILLLWKSLSHQEGSFRLLWEQLLMRSWRGKKNLRLRIELSRWLRVVASITMYCHRALRTLLAINGSTKKTIEKKWHSKIANKISNNTIVWIEGEARRCIFQVKESNNKKSWCEKILRLFWLICLQAYFLF